VHLVLPDHLGQRQSELSRAHRPGERDEHLAAPREVIDVRLRRVDHHGGVEVAVVVRNKVLDRGHRRSPATL